MAFTAILALLLGSAYAVPASARFLNRITEAEAYGVTDLAVETAYNHTSWAEEWGDECNRQTAWTYSCSIEIWSEAQGGPDCWREFDVASSIWTGRLRTEDWTRWSCDPPPSTR